MVRIALNLLDPDGVDVRRRKRLRRRQYHNPGPNYLWHIDGYDKLKPYGIAIHGAVDGFSRYLLWLEAGVTNNDPQVVASYYMATVEQMNGCPKAIRSDRGTENVVIERLQIALRQKYEFSEFPAYMYGRSTNNQRIEALWGFLRRQQGQFWMNLFQSMKDDNYFEGDPLEKSLIQFCFMKLIKVNCIQ